MTTSSAKQTLQRFFATADVKINGDRPWDIQVKDERAYSRILRFHNLGLGESYMDGWIDCQRWDEFVTRILRSSVEQEIRSNWRLLFYTLQGSLLNLGSKARAFQIGKTHYDIGNELYEKMLDKRMVYTCAYWRDANTLDEAQEAKLDLVCRKLKLEPGMRVLDIGCGWGSFAKFAAEKYGVRVVGVTVSREQAVLARKLCKGYDIEIRLQDYRDVDETFDRVVSLGMFEHVFYKNYRTYMDVVHRSIGEGGLFLLQTIGGNPSVKSTDPWIHKYIFPNSMLPSAVQISDAVEGRFVMEDWHSFGPDYDKTLMAWYDNFDKHWPSLSHTYDDRFYRMWKYYLLSCAGTFRSRANQLWQIVLSKNGVMGGYDPNHIFASPRQPLQKEKEMLVCNIR